MSLLVGGIVLEVIWIGLNQILTIIIQLSLHANSLAIHLVIGAMSTQGLESLCQLLPFESRLQAVHGSATRNLLLSVVHICLTTHVIHYHRHGSDNLIVLLTGCELGLSPVHRVVPRHHVAQLSLLVLLGPRNKWQYVRVAVGARSTRGVAELLLWLLDTDFFA